MSFQEYIKPELLVLIPVLYLIGLGLKHCELPNKWIPLSLGIIAIVLSTMFIFTTTSISSVKEIIYAIFTSMTQGILLAGASVYANQLYIQGKKKE